MRVVFFQAEDGIRDLVRSRGLGDVYKRQGRAPVRAAGLHGAKGRPLNRPGAKADQGSRTIGLSLIHI